MTEKEMELAAQEQERKEKEAAIYASYGVSQDKLEGSMQFGNGVFKGVAVMVSALSLLMVITCGILSGVTSSLFVFSICSMAVEGTLLSQETRPNKPMRVLSRIFYMFPLPFNLVLLILYLVNRTFADISLAYSIIMVVFATLELVLTGFGSISYFIYDPYHMAHKQIRAARRQIKQEIKKKKEQEKRQRKMSLAAIRKEEKGRKKEQRRLRRLDRKERMNREKEQLRAFAARQQLRAVALTRKKQKEDTKTGEDDSRKEPKKPA